MSFLSIIEKPEYFDVNRVKIVLLEYKTNKCLNVNHYIKENINDDYINCYNYHTDNEKRRCPFYSNIFNLEEKLSYCEEKCTKENCNNSNCEFSHTDIEVMFHPKIYKIDKCNFKNHNNNYSRLSELSTLNSSISEINKSQRKKYSELSIELKGSESELYHNKELCPYYHSNEDMRINPTKSKIDLSSLNNKNLLFFKTQKCQILLNHNYNECFYYHSNIDRRREQFFFNYSFEYCQIDNTLCTKGDLCDKSHNEVEVLYHKNNFRTKFCRNYESDNINSKKICRNGKFCHSAHTDYELQIPLLHKIPRDENFVLYFYKTTFCPFVNSHDEINCVYAHSHIDFRRNPFKYNYSQSICELYSNTSSCQDGNNCNQAHGKIEYDYHPLTYKTILCNSPMELCERGEFCPNIHSNEDKRNEKQRQRKIKVNFDFTNKNKKKLSNQNTFNNLNLSSSNINNILYPIQENKSYRHKNNVNSCSSFKSIDNRLFPYNNYENNRLSANNKSIMNIFCNNDNKTSITSYDFNKNSFNYRISNYLEDFNNKSQIQSNEYNKCISVKDQLINYLVNNKLNNIQYVIEKNKIKVEELIRLNEDNLYSLLEEENKNKISDLKDFLIKLEDNQETENLLKEINNAIDSWNI